MGKRTSEVLLTQNLFKLGLMGDIVAVAPGYARNFLLPSGRAVLADGAAKRQIEILRERACQEQAQIKEQAAAQAQRMQGLTITIAANVSHDDHLFGSVGIRDIVAALAEKGFAVNNNQVSMHENIRRLGVYPIRLDLFDEVSVEVTLTVTNAHPEAELDTVLAAAVDETTEDDDEA